MAPMYLWLATVLTGLGGMMYAYEIRYCYIIVKACELIDIKAILHIKYFVAPPAVLKRCQDFDKLSTSPTLRVII